MHCFLYFVVVAGSFLPLQTSAVPCTNLPPGINYLLSSVDITKVVLNPIEGVIPGGFKNPLITLTCNNGNTWRSPKGTVYQLPDQVWEVRSMPSGSLHDSENLYTSFNDVRTSMAFEVGGSATVQKFGFSASTSYRNMQSKMTNSSKYISDLSYYQSSTQMKLKPIAFADLDYFARTSINMSLIGSYESNPKAYDLLIDSIGTHYIQTANLGGLVRVILETKRDYFITATEEQAKTNAGATFLNFLSVKGMASKESRNVDSTYTSSTTRRVKYYGGDINLMEGNSYERWQPTVDQNPWMFSCEVQPISQLIKDEAHRASLDLAINRRIYLSYLDEMEKLIKGFTILDPVLSNLTNWVARIKNKTVMDESEVEAVGQAGVSYYRSCFILKEHSTLLPVGENTGWATMRWKCKQISLRRRERHDTTV